MGKICSAASLFFLCPARARRSVQSDCDRPGTWSTRPGALEWAFHMVAGAGTLQERADGHETRLWALHAECSMLAFCLAWDGREIVGGAFTRSGQ